MRAERALTKEDVKRIGDAFRTWRCTPSAAAKGLIYENVPGFCEAAALAEIKAADYALTLGPYVGGAADEDDGGPIDEKIARLKTELLAVFDESAPLEKVVRDQLERIDV